MISVTCTNCRAVLTIDDAFAGGVCRCEHCGTIQTVPRLGQPSAAPQAPAARVPKTLYQHESRLPAAPPPARTSAGLEQLAEAVASSGLTGSGLTSNRSLVAQVPPAGAPSDAPPSERRSSAWPVILILSASLGVVLVILVIVLLIHGSGSTGTAVGPKGTAGADLNAGPSFCGLPLDADNVIFVLDRGNSIGDLFDTLKATCYKSLKQLGPDRKFQVILWDNDSGSAEFPSGAMRSATVGAIDDCTKDFQDVVAAGSSHLSGPIREALGRHPQLIVVVTGKSELDEDDTAAIRSAAGAGVRIDAVQIASTSPNSALEQLCKSTGGLLRLVSAGELREFSR